MLVLVTGGAGYMGPALIEKLLNSGHTVRTIDNFWRGKKDSLAGLDVDLVEGDIRNPEDIQSLMKEIDVVFHLAAQPSVPISEIESNYTEQANVTGTRLLLSAAKKEGVKKFIFYSTMGVYGNVSSGLITENTALNPTCQSSITKATGEFLCKSFWLNYQLPTIILRYGVVYGLSQGLQYFDEFHGTLPNRSVYLAMSKEPITIYGNGNQTRGFIHIEDAADLGILVMNKEGIYGEAFNAYSEVLTVNELVETVKSVIQNQENVPVEIKYVPNPRIEEVSLPYTASSEKIKNTLGFDAQHTLATGISELINWLKENGLVCK
jgi:nucleoside-diphosphate-sugar epimerase